MNLEIKQKYDNFIKIIEKKENVDNKEKISWLEQNNKYNKYSPDLLIYNNDVIIPNDNIFESTNFFNNTQSANLSKEQIIENCECLMSSGYTSDDLSKQMSKSKSKSKSVDLLSNSLDLSNSLNSLNSLNKSNNNINSKTNVNYIINKNINNQDMSLLDDDFEIDIKNKTQKDSKNIKNIKNFDQDSNFNYSNINSIKSEFKHIFGIDNNKNLLDLEIPGDKNDNFSIKNELEKIYTKELKKREKKNNVKKTNNYDIAKYINDDNKNISSNDMLKKLSVFVEKYLFEESTRGWNFTHNLFKINIKKIIDNLTKIIFNKNNTIKIGFFYRDYLNPKTSLEKDFTKYWIGYEISSEDNNIKKIDYSIKNKILYYSFKNLSKSSKFKKRIGKYNYKLIKKTVEVVDQKDLIIDVIFYVGIKNV